MVSAAVRVGVSSQGSSVPRGDPSTIKSFKREDGAISLASLD